MSLPGCGEQACRESCRGTDATENRGLKKFTSHADQSSTWLVRASSEKSTCRLAFHLMKRNSPRGETRPIRDEGALEQIALAWARAARVSLDETQLAAWGNAAHPG
jgi:hypothetical protein